MKKSSGENNQAFFDRLIRKAIDLPLALMEQCSMFEDDSVSIQELVETLFLSRLRKKHMMHSLHFRQLYKDYMNGADNIVDLADEGDRLDRIALEK